MSTKSRRARDRAGAHCSKAWREVSNGRYFGVTSGNGGADLTDALGRIFSEIQAVNSVFASVSLPVSITTQGTFLNQVYIGHVPARTPMRCRAGRAT